MKKGLNNTSQIKRALVFWKLLSFVFFCIIVFLVIIEINVNSDNPFDINTFSLSRQTPYYNEVMKVIKPLRYNGLYRILDPEVYITLDFDKDEWTLHNIHHYDQNGDLILPRKRYGLCNELATYVYGQIKDLFDESYDFEYIRAAESGFFLSPQSSHTIIRITKNHGKYKSFYLLDPSFKRYGPSIEFEDYIFIDSIPCKIAPKGLSTDETIPISHTSPLIIKKNILVSFLVESNNQVFNKNNFIFAITATKRHNYAGRFIIALRVNDGELEILQNDELGIQILGEKDYNILKTRIKKLFDDIIQELGHQSSTLSISKDF
jgi:hypothetical protein